MPPYLPLRWESTGEQWWYASPIDCAAANGHYDLVVELLHLDANLLIKLTSLRRIRRLETVWDDEKHFEDVAKCRSQVARNLMLECEAGRAHNSLIRAGYGGWLLYTAASAGDVDFVKELLGKYPALVFGEGEYGVTDILYAAARSNSCEVFELLLRSALSPPQMEDVYERDMMNRAVHAAARGGNWEMLKRLVRNGSGVLGFRDTQGCTVLHTAAARGQVEVVRNLLASFDVVNLTDDQGNTALHIASYGGNALCTHQKAHVIGGSPGTSFRIPDAEIFLYTGIENSSDATNYDQASVESYSCSNELNNSDSANSPHNKKSNSVNARRSKFRLHWPRRRETKAAASELEDDDDSHDPFSSSRNLEEFPIPLRQRYSQPCSLPNNKRTQPMRTSLPSPSSNVKFSAGLMQGVIQLKPHSAHSTPSPFQELSVSSLSYIKKQKGVEIMGPSCSNRSIDDGTLLLNYKQCSFNKKLMNGYFSFGAQGLAVEDSNSCAKSNSSYKRLSSIVA
ncbi:hypothetical protein JHK84_032535 [Glycine max]|nr:hypothetical protein JHK84_032535 [Glycine max]